MDYAKLNFAVFIIHQLAQAWHLSPQDVYERLVKLNVLDGYILPCYDTLHSLGSQYLVEDITELVEEREATS